MWEDWQVLRGDGNLNHEIDPDDKSPQDSCGVFGVWAPGEEVARLTYFGLYALQHRGQQSAGIATADGQRILVYKDMGLVSQVFDEQSLHPLTGHIALGHVRYATTGASTWENAQPTLGPTALGTVAMAHNGNLTNTAELLDYLRREFGEDLSGELGRGSSTDTAVITALLGALSANPRPTAPDSAALPVAAPAQPDSAIDSAIDPAVDSAGQPMSKVPRPALFDVAHRVFTSLRGAFSLVFMDENTLYAARDPHGIRPLVLGRLQNGWAVASETAALDIVGATFVREVEPGELLAISASGVTSERFAKATPTGCVFEYVYLARPDTSIAGRSIIHARTKMGAALAKEHPVEADLVIPTPDSGTPAAIGYAREAGIPFAHGLVKNAYVGRTFIQPTQTIRQLGIRLKLNPLREIIAGQRLIVVDDSIVRGNTQRALVRMLREAGAAEVHVRISSPSVMWPCFYGIDFATRAELIATGMNTAEICASIGADSLGFLSLEGMVAATGQAPENLCLACFNGKYPVSVAALVAGQGVTGTK